MILCLTENQFGRCWWFRLRSHRIRCSFENTAFPTRVQWDSESCSCDSRCWRRFSLQTCSAPEVVPSSTTVFGRRVTLRLSITQCSTANYRTRLLSECPVLLITWDPPATQLPHNPACFRRGIRFGVNAAFEYSFMGSKTHLNVFPSNQTWWKLNNQPSFCTMMKSRSTNETLTCLSSSKTCLVSSILFLLTCLMATRFPCVRHEKTEQ